MAGQKRYWDIGTAYDFFMSLHVLHNPERVGLRGSWAAGVRSRLPLRERKILESADSFIWLPLPWVFSLPDPKDSHTVLNVLSKVSAADRLPTLSLRPIISDQERYLLLDIRERGSWKKKDAKDLKTLQKNRGRQVRQVAIETILNAWANAAETGESYLAALQVYYEVFFAEEERRILPALEESQIQAHQLSKKLGVQALIEELSQGVRFEPPLFHPEGDLVLVPSFWLKPLVVYEQLAEDRWLFLYGGRPVEYSLVPGDLVPDSMLQALKALADPTRLRILRHLLYQPMTPSQLARELRLRAPTVVHHLSELRLAGLVYLTVDTPGKKSERRYVARMEPIPKLFETMQNFLTQVEAEAVEDVFEP